MGSSVATHSNAVDNRLAVTDNAVGVNNYGGKTAYQAPIFDFSQQISTSGRKSSVFGSGGVNGVNISILDQGAIEKSFNFAGYALSETLAYLIDGQKRAQESVEYTADTVSQALQQASNTQAAAAAATAAAQQEITGGLMQWAEENGVRLLVIAGGAFVVWKLWGPK